MSLRAATILSLFAFQQAFALPVGENVAASSVSLASDLPNLTNITMTEDSTGSLILGSDGVLRSVAGNGTVLAYQRLSPGEIAAYADAEAALYTRDGLPIPVSVLQFQEAEQRGIDGRLVEDEEQLYSNSQQQPVSYSSPVSKEGKEGAQGIVIADDEPDGTQTMIKRQTMIWPVPDPLPRCAGLACRSDEICRQVGCRFCYRMNGPDMPGYCLA